MKKFRIIPVLDILNSEAVHAVKGLREEYKPIVSPLFHTTNPFKIAKFLKHRYGFNEIYIADLDSIIKRVPNFNILSNLLRIADLKVIIDPGINSIEDVRKFSKYGYDKLIIALETINNLGVISESIKMVGNQNIIVSVDMYQEKIVSKVKEFNLKSVPDVVHKIEDLGIYQILLLDLYRVGQKLGDIPALYREIREKYGYNLLVGGGIKEVRDIIKYANLKFNGVLIGTALYDGSIKVEDIKKLLSF